MDIGKEPTYSQCKMGPIAGEIRRFSLFWPARGTSGKRSQPASTKRASRPNCRAQRVTRRVCKPPS